MKKAKDASCKRSLMQRVHLSVTVGSSWSAGRYLCNTTRHIVLIMVVNSWTKILDIPRMFLGKNSNKSTEKGNNKQGECEVNSCASVLEQDSSLTLLFWCLDSGLRKTLPRARRQERGSNQREREKQNERLAAGVNCLSHQTDFLIP